MKDRITTFLRTENKTSLQFAEEIGVQPSSISHIISGRNNPSLDFVLKMLNRYDFISIEWLLFGKGNMYKDEMGPTLFDINNPKEQVDRDSIETTEHHASSEDNDLSKMEPNLAGKSTVNNLTSDTDDTGDKPHVEKIVWFYNDNSFKVFNLK
jgi:transcriptional regulator with XRE-family HTH domain